MSVCSRKKSVILQYNVFVNSNTLIFAAGINIVIILISHTHTRIDAQTSFMQGREQKIADSLSETKHERNVDGYSVKSMQMQTC